MLQNNVRTLWHSDSALINVIVPAALAHTRMFYRATVAVPPAGRMVLISSTHGHAEMPVSSRPACNQCCCATAGCGLAAFPSLQWSCDDVTVAMRFQVVSANQSIVHRLWGFKCVVTFDTKSSSLFYCVHTTERRISLFSKNEFKLVHL